MVYDPVLNEIEEILWKDYFKFLRYNFWKDYAAFRNQEINPEWFKSDSFSVPMTDLDLNTGKQFTSFYTPKLSETIKRDIRSRFSTVLIKINKYIISAGKGFQLPLFKQNIIYQLEKILAEVNNIEADKFYQEIINSQVEKEFSKFKKALTHFEETRKDYVISSPTAGQDDAFYFYYKPYDREDELGKIALDNFIQAFRNSNFIEKTTPLTIKKFFIDELPLRKIRWKKSGAEFKYLFLELKKRDFIKTTDIWIAVANQFQLIKKNGAEATNEEMKVQSKLKNPKRRIRIDALIELLEVEDFEDLP
jgi:hypothetical protein